MAGHGEKTMKQILEKLNKVVEKNEEMDKKTEEMESEILKCQDEILALKRSKLDLKRQYDQTAKEVTTLKATINDMKFLSGATDMTTKTEFASVRKDIKNVQNDIKDMKIDVSRISASVQETNRLSRGVGEQGRILNTLTDRFNTAVHKLDVTDRRVDKLQMVFKWTHASIQATKDLGEEVSNLKTETSTLIAKVNHQEQQQQQLQKQHQQLQLQQQMQQPPQQSVSSPAPPPTPGAVAASLPVKKPSPTPGAVAASLPVKKLTPQQLKKIQEDSKFVVGNPFIEGSLRSGQPTRVGEYDHVITPSPYLNKDSGVYKTPVKGKYTFGGGMWQTGSGKMSLFVCGDREWRRKLFGKTDRDGGCDRSVSWECEEGESVWLEVVSTKGKAEVRDCKFYGQLME